MWQETRHFSPPPLHIPHAPQSPVGVPALEPLQLCPHEPEVSLQLPPHPKRLQSKSPGSHPSLCHLVYTHLHLSLHTETHTQHQRVTTCTHTPVCVHTHTHAPPPVCHLCTHTPVCIHTHTQCVTCVHTPHLCLHTPPHLRLHTHTVCHLLYTHPICIHTHPHLRLHTHTRTSQNVTSRTHTSICIYTHTHTPLHREAPCPSLLPCPMGII